MEHQEALDTHAAEGYLLGDLTAAEYAAFEEHFADCDECFADIRDTATVVAAVRGTEEKKEPAKRRQYKPLVWFPVAASVAFAMLGTIGVQAHKVTQLKGQLAELNQPHKIPVHTLIVQRGPEKKDFVDGNRDSVLEFDIDLDLASAPFTCKIVDVHGNTRGRPFSVTANEARDLVSLRIPAKFFEPGTYSLIVTGTGGVSEPVKTFEVR